MLAIVFVALKLGRDSLPACAITGASKLAGGGRSDGNVVSGFHAFGKPVGSLDAFDGLAAGKGGADVSGLVTVESVQGEFNDLGNWLCGDGHLGWSVELACVAQLRPIYTAAVYPQDKSTLFLCSSERGSFSPMN